MGRLKAGWEGWAPVLQQLPSAAVEGVQSGLQATAAAGRSAMGKVKSRTNEASAATAATVASKSSASIGSSVSDE